MTACPGWYPDIRDIVVAAELVLETVALSGQLEWEPGRAALLWEVAPLSRLFGLARREHLSALAVVQPRWGRGSQVALYPRQMPSSQLKCEKFNLKKCPPWFNYGLQEHKVQFRMC